MNNLELRNIYKSFVCTGDGQIPVSTWVSKRVYYVASK